MTFFARLICVQAAISAIASAEDFHEKLWNDVLSKANKNIGPWRQSGDPVTVKLFFDLLSVMEVVSEMKKAF